MRRLLAPSMTEAHRRQDDAVLRLRRYLTAGNAGGAIATLSFLGASLPHGAGDPHVQGLYFVLVGFLIGLFVLLVALLIELVRRRRDFDQALVLEGLPEPKDPASIEAALEHWDRHSKAEKLSPVGRLWRLEWVFSVIAGLVLIASTAGALYVLSTAIWNLQEPQRHHFPAWPSAGVSAPSNGVSKGFEVSP